jgi:hypothetical protein
MSTTDLKKSRGGRPPAKDPKRLKIQVRVTKEEKETIRRIAESRGLTVSALLVMLALGAQAEDRPGQGS